MNDFENKLKGGIVGVAVGDALGVPVEFKSRRSLQINPIVDMVGYGSYKQPAGTWSDDSSMTFCTIESLCNGYDLKDIANNFVKWRYESFWTPYGVVFDIGISTTKAIEEYKLLQDPKRSGNSGERSNGNGSLMRILPLAFYLKDQTVPTRFRVVKEVSSITHAHIRSAIACFIYIEMATQLLNGLDKFSAYRETVKITKEYLGKYPVSYTEVQNFSRVLGGAIHSLSENSINSSGYVLHSLEAAIWSFLRQGTYSDTVLECVNLGSDTDTTAAIAGGLAGIHYGFDVIPADWVRKLARSRDVLALVEKFHGSLNGNKTVV